ncbi:MAG: GAF domain-containing protein, partial [Chloroflexi bacterium]|nr:GAF domain-containing protein [Chloroflexota bacterium]
RTRTLLTIGLVTAALTAILGLLFSQTLLRAFAEAEVRDTERDVHHARMFLTDELRAMDVLNHDWASWDDTYAFIEDANPAYIRANLTDATFQNTHLNLMLFVHTSGRVVWAGAYDLEASREVPVPQGVYDALGLLARPTEEGQRGLLLLPEGVLLVTARPILTFEDQGPARGAVVFGRYLNSDIQARISAHLDLSVTAHRADRPQDWPDDLRAAYPSLSPEAPVLARPLDDARIAGYGLMTDLYGRPALILRTEGPRDIVARGRMALQYLVVTTAALGLLVTLAAVLQIDRSVLARLAALRADVRAVGAEGELRRRVAVRGRDELADLARAFNETLDALEAARREREEQEAQLRRLAENSPDVIYRLILSPFRPLYVSPAVTSLLGYPPEEFYKDRDLPYRLIHPDDHALLQAALRLDIPPEQPLVLRWVSRSGQVVWAEHRHFVVYDEAGRAVAVEGIARDITAQKQAEEELAHLNAVLRAIHNINQAIARERDRERLLQQACEELVRTRGYTGAWCVATDEAGRAVRGSAAGCVQEGFPALLQAWTAGTPPDCARQALAVPDPVITPDPMACTACPLRFPYRGAAALTVRMAYGGRVYGVLSVALPAGIPPSSEEQRLLAEVASDLAFALHSLEQEEALRESEERFRLLAEHALTGIYLIQDGLLRYVNPAGARMFGYEPEELIDRLGPLDVVAPEDREQVAENIRKRLTGEALSVRYTVQGLRKDGSRFPCEVLGTRVEYRGRPAILGTVLDLTDRVRAEEAVRRQAAQTEALRQIGLELFAQTDLNVLLPSIVRRALDLVGGSAGGLYLYRPEADVLEWVVSVGPDQPPLGTCLRPSEGGIACRVWETGRPFWVDDYQHWEGRAARYADYPWTAVIGVPVRRGEEMLGVLVLLADPPRTFSPADADVLELFAAQTAVALTNARLYDEVRREREHLDFLHQLGQRLSATLDVRAVAREALETLRAMTEADQGVICLAEPGTSRLRIIAATGHDEASVEELDRRLQLRVGQGLTGWVALHRQAAVVDDVSRDDRWLVVRGLDEEVRSAVSVPLLFGEELVGVMSLGSLREAAFTPDHVRLLEAAGAVLAGALLNARLYEQERAARQRLEALYRIGQAVNSTLDPALILDQLTGEAMRATGATHGSVLVPDPERGVFERRSLRGYSPEERSRAIAQPLSLDRGINGRAYRLRQGVYVPDVRQDPNYFPLISTTRSELVLPLMRGDRILGLLDLQSPQVDAFRDVDMGFLRALADQVAVALENARLYQEERRRSQEQEILALIATALNTLQVRRAFPILVRGLQELTGCDRVAVALLEDDRAHYRISVLETPYPVLTEGTVLPLSTTPVWDDLLGGQPRFCPDMGAEVEYEAIRALYDAGFRSYVSLPLWAGGRVIGALHLVSLREQNFRREQVPVLQRVADALAAAIENERLYRAEREQRELAQALAESAAVITRTLDPTQMLEQIIEQVARVVPGDAFNVMLVEDGSARIVRWRGYEGFGAEEWVAAAVLPVADLPNLWEMVRTGEPVLVPDTHADPHWARIRGLEWVRSYVAAPIVIRGITVGFLNVDGTRPHQFGPADAARLKAFADQVAIALENARLYTELRHYAGTLEEQVRERTAQLAAQYARLEAILRSTGDGILLTDARGEILQANPVAQRWLARDLAPEDARKLQEAIRRVARRAQERPEEIVELPGLDLQVRASPIEGPDGEETAVVVLHDVTQFKTLERLRTRFISNISHELRTPLTTIKTYLYFLRETPDLLPQCLDILEREADWQARLVEDVLEISRLDSGALRMHFSPVGLNALAAEVVDAQRPLALAQGLVLEYRPAEAEPVAWGDPDGLRIVLINLVRNSIQYTPAG